ncbi:hypothetical protein G9A89_003143 [Geosiphon pyriformis]|nr:hypothetical protein G9A89_003143 [Geosiphon pyriformis]
MESFPLDLFPTRGLVHVALFKNVSNAAELRERLIARDEELSYGFIDARVVLDVFQILVAVNTAVYYEQQNKLKTHNLHSEIVYSLSPTTNITESLRRFGISNTTTGLVTIKVGRDVNEVKAHLSTLIKGELTTLDKFSELVELSAVRKYYKIDKRVEDSREILDNVIGAIAIKPIL